MKIHNWEDVIKYFFEKGYRIYSWDYITALRSGDNLHDTWKFLITCLIRGDGLDGIAWDISWTKDYLHDYTDDQIKHKLKEVSKDISQHYIGHNRRGLEVLATYYRDAIKNNHVADLLIELSTKIAMEKDRPEMPKIVRQIVNLLYNTNYPKK